MCQLAASNALSPRGRTILTIDREKSGCLALLAPLFQSSAGVLPSIMRIGAAMPPRETCKRRQVNTVRAVGSLSNAEGLFDR